MEENRDMFDYYDELPIEVQAILDKYSEMDNNYTNCDKLIDELVAFGLIRNFIALDFEKMCDYHWKHIKYGNSCNQRHQDNVGNCHF